MSSREELLKEVKIRYFPGTKIISFNGSIACIWSYSPIFNRNNSEITIYMRLISNNAFVYLPIWKNGVWCEIIEDIELELNIIRELIKE